MEASYSTPNIQSLEPIVPQIHSAVLVVTDAGVVIRRFGFKIVFRTVQESPIFYNLYGRF